MSTANLSRAETAARSAAITLHRIRLELDVTGSVNAARDGFPTATTLVFDATTEQRDHQQRAIRVRTPTPQPPDRSPVPERLLGP